MKKKLISKKFNSRIQYKNKSIKQFIFKFISKEITYNNLHEFFKYGV